MEMKSTILSSAMFGKLTGFLALASLCVALSAQPAFAQADVASAGVKETLKNNAEVAKEYPAIAKTIATYIEGASKGSSALMKQAFFDKATIHYSDGKVIGGGPIDELYGRVEGKVRGHIPYEITSLDVAHNLAIVHLEIANWGGAKFSDMFTLLKVGGEWKLINKISYKHP